MSPRKNNAHNVVEVDPNSFGGQLRRYRVAAGLTQTELGESIGLDQKRVSTFERNEVTPGEDIIIALAEALNVPPGRFFELSRFRGVLPLGTARREKMRELAPGDWQTIDRFMDTLRDLTPEDRAEFDRNFAAFLSKWHGS